MADAQAEQNEERLATKGEQAGLPTVTPSGEIMRGRTASEARLAAPEFWKKLDAGATIEVGSVHH